MVPLPVRTMEFEIRLNYTLDQCIGTGCANLIRDEAAVFNAKSGQGYFGRSEANGWRGWA